MAIFLTFKHYKIGEVWYTRIRQRSFGKSTVCLSVMLHAFACHFLWMIIIRRPAKFVKHYFHCSIFLSPFSCHRERFIRGWMRACLRAAEGYHITTFIVWLPTTDLAAHRIFTLRACISKHQKLKSPKKTVSNCRKSWSDNDDAGGRNRNATGNCGWRWWWCRWWWRRCWCWCTTWNTKYKTNLSVRLRLQDEYMKLHIAFEQVALSCLHIIHP